MKISDPPMYTHKSLVNPHVTSPRWLTIEMLSAKTHALASDACAKFEAKDPEAAWWRKRRVIRALMRELGSDAIACAHVVHNCVGVDEVDVPWAVGRAKEMSRLMSVEALEAKAQSMRDLDKNVAGFLDTNVSAWMRVCMYVACGIGVRGACVRSCCDVVKMAHACTLLQHACASMLE